jgi:Flp pilus assembly protein TadD
VRLHILHVLFLLSFFTSTAFAQDREGVTLQVRVVWQDERAVRAMVELQLLNHSGIPVQQTLTGPDGIGQFERLTPGSYKVKATSAGIQDAQLDSIEIMEDEKLRIERLHVLPLDSTHARESPQQSVSAAELSVPAKARKSYEKALAAFARGDLPKAVNEFEAAVTEYPKYARAWNDLGVARAKSGDQAAAKQAWQKAIEADEKFPSPYLNLARAAMSEKHASEAEQLASQALSHDSNNPEALYVLFNAQYAQNEAKPALDTEQKLHAVEHKRFADVHVFAGQLLLNANQDSLAMAEFQTYLKEAPDGPRVAAVRKAMAQIQAQGAPAQ